MYEHSFTSTLQYVGNQGGVAVIVPPEVIISLKGGARPKVKARIDGAEYRGSLAPYGGVHFLGIRKDIRKTIGKEPQQKVKIELALDDQPRTVELSPEFDRALKKSIKAKTFFESLSYTNRKEFARWISEAKKEETKKRRLEEAIAKLTHGEKLH